MEKAKGEKSVIILVLVIALFRGLFYISSVYAGQAKSPYISLQPYFLECYLNFLPNQSFPVSTPHPRNLP